MRDTVPEDLVSKGLRRPPAGLVVHSDQGSQYTATHLKDIIAKHGAQQRMSRRGNCYDNALRARPTPNGFGAVSRPSYSTAVSPA